MLDDVTLTDKAVHRSRRPGRRAGTTSKEIVGAMSRRMVDLHAPGFVGRRNSVVSFRVPSRMKYTVSLLKGKTTISKVTKTATAGLNNVGLRCPGHGGRLHRPPDAPLGERLGAGPGPRQAVAHPSTRSGRGPRPLLGARAALVVE